MRIFVVLHNGQKLIIEEAEDSDSVLDLKKKIKLAITTSQPPDSPHHDHLPLSFSSRDLEDDKLLKDYSIKHESEVHVKGKQYGYSIPASVVKANTDKRTIMRETNWVLDRGFISFKPITDSSQIPYYNEVTKQDCNYHQGLNEDDISWIRKYTGPDYKKLKVQSYTLNPDDEQLEFLKKLYLACWVADQDNLPETVYHVCNLTPRSYSWFKKKMIFYSPAFVSTSTNSDLQWSGNCKWEITLQKGKRHHVVDVKTMSQHPDEDEILLSCCTRFRVLYKSKDFKDDPDFEYYVKLEYLDL